MQRVETRGELQSDPVRDREAAAGCLDHSRFGRKGAGSAVDARPCTIVVAEQRLVHGLGEHHVRDGVVGVEQAGDLGVGGGRLRGRNCGQRRAVGVCADAAPPHLGRERKPIDDVAGLDRLDGDAGVRACRREAIGDQGECLAQSEDEVVHLGEPVGVVQAALELVAEQCGERLAVAHAVEHRDGRADAARAEVDGESFGCLGRCVREVAASQDRGGRGVVERRRMQEPAVRRIALERRCAGGRGDHNACSVARDRLVCALPRAHVLQPAERADVDARVAAVGVICSQRGEPLMGETPEPRVEPVGAAVDVFGEQSFEARAGHVAQRVERVQLFGQEACGAEVAEHGRDVVGDEHILAPRDAGIVPVEHSEAALARTVVARNVDERRFATHPDRRGRVDQPRVDVQTDAAVPVAEQERMPQQQVEQRVRRGGAEALLPAHQLERRPCAIGEPLQVVPVVARHRLQGVGLRERPALDERAAEPLRRREQEEPQHLGLDARPRAEAPEQLVGPRVGTARGVCLQHALAGSREIRPVVQVGQALGVPLTVLHRCRLQPEDVEQRLEGRVGGTDARRALRELRPVLARDSQPACERIEQLGLTCRPLSGAQPRERGGRHDPVRLRADPEGRHGSAPADEAGEERAQLQLGPLVEQRLQQRSRHVAERCRPQRRLHGPGLELVSALRSRHLQEGARVDAEPLGEPLPIALEEPVRAQREARDRCEGVDEARIGIVDAARPGGRLVRVVRRGALAHEREARLPVPVMFEQGLELGLRLARIAAQPEPDHEQPVESCARRLVERDAEAEPVLHGPLEVDEPAQLVGHDQLAVRIVQLPARGCRRVGPDDEPRRQGRAELLEHSRAVDVAEQQQPIGEERRSGRSCPRCGLRRRSRRQQQEGHGDGHVGAREWRGRLLGEVRRRRSGDERICPRRPDRRDERCSGRCQGGRIVAGAPDRRPVRRHVCRFAARQRSVQGDRQEHIACGDAPRAGAAGIERCVPSADPGRSTGPVRGDERAPRRPLPIDVAGGAPDIRPVALGSVDLDVGELGLEAVDEAVVGEGAHPQLGRGIAAAEARLEPEREEQEGQPVLEPTGARARIGDLAERVVRPRRRRSERREIAFGRLARSGRRFPLAHGGRDRLCAGAVTRVETAAERRLGRARAQLGRLRREQPVARRLGCGARLAQLGSTVGEVRHCRPSSG